MQNENDNRTVFDWTIFALIHLVVIGAISVVAYYLYGKHLGIWVAASAIVAGLTSAYMYAKNIPGETLMKVVLGIAVAANAGYIAHNSAKKIGVDDYNGKQLEKFEKGMEIASRTTKQWIARELRLGAEASSKIETVFSGEMASTAALLAFAELGIALAIFAIASRRLADRRSQALAIVSGPVALPAPQSQLQGKAARP